jgi:HEAT repeat protein
MGLFDRWKGDKDGKAPSQVPEGSPAAKWADKAGDKRAQNYDRQEAIGKLAEMGTADAASALLRRFTFNMDPSITDQEEKDAAYNGILFAGKEAIEPVRAFAEKAESLAWPMKILKEVLDEEAYIGELVLWLSRWDTEYRKFIDPKLQLLTALEEYKSPKIREAVAPFLLDVNEPARFHAVATTLAQDDPAAVPALIEALEEEESFRVKMKGAEGLLIRGWPIPPEKQDVAKKALPPGYFVDSEGRVKKR